MSVDLDVAMNSEVFREYAKNEIAKIATEKEAEEDLSASLEEFTKFQNEVLASPYKLKVFKALQEKFASDPEYTSKVKKVFVDAVMLLDLGK